MLESHCQRVAQGEGPWGQARVPPGEKRGESVPEHAVSASELRDRSADLLENVDRGRVLIRKHGEDRAYLISVRELRALEETIAVLEDQDLLRTIRRSLADVEAGRVQDAADAFAELDAEFRNEE